MLTAHAPPLAPDAPPPPPAEWQADGAALSPAQRQAAMTAGGEYTDHREYVGPTPAGVPIRSLPCPSHPVLYPYSGVRYPYSVYLQFAVWPSPTTRAHVESNGAQSLAQRTPSVCVLDFDFVSVGVLQRVNLLWLRCGTRSARMQVGQCEGNGAW